MSKLFWNEREETLDTLFEGRLKVLQKKSGYRFSIDALLLAHFVETRPGDRIIELGTGCGIIPLILILRRKTQKVIGVEIQPSLADLARRNAALNRASTRIQIWERDFKKLAGKRWRETFHLVLCNPPYRRLGTGRINLGQEKAVARHEIKATLEDVLQTAYHLLKEKGRLSLIYPASRATDLIYALRKFHLEPKRWQFVYSRWNDEARLLLAEAVKGGHPHAQVLPPFIIYDAAGEYTPQAQQLFCLWKDKGPRHFQPATCNATFQDPIIKCR